MNEPDRVRRLADAWRTHLEVRWRAEGIPEIELALRVAALDPAERRPTVGEALAAAQLLANEGEGRPLAWVAERFLDRDVVEELQLAPWAASVRQVLRTVALAAAERSAGEEAENVVPLRHRKKNDR